MLTLALQALACGDAPDDSGADTNADAGPPDAGGLDEASLERQGCDLDAKAVRYEASSGSEGTPSGTDDDSLIPCLHVTGLGSAENNVGIASDGTVFVSPVFTDEGHGLLRSRDQGESWEVIIPGQRGGAEHVRPQPFMFLDPSDRLFHSTPGAGGFDLSISDDLGDSWRATSMMSDTADWMKILAGPAVSSEPAHGHMLYAAAPSPISTLVVAGLGPKFQKVQRSLDGGDTWQDVGGDQLNLVPEEQGCPASESVIYGNGVVAPDGTVYLGLRRCTSLAVAVSRDEGDSWEVNDVPDATMIPHTGAVTYLVEHNVLSPEPLAIDEDGNLYAVWGDADNRIRFSVSRDGTDTWSTPVTVNAPGTAFGVIPAMAVRAPGVLALGYYGSPDDVTFDGYLAETRNALDPKPEFASHKINSDGPLASNGFDEGYTHVLSGGDLIEMIGVKYAPNGDLWAAFVRDMCPGPGSAGACDWDQATHADSPYQAIIARLVHR